MSRQGSYCYQTQSLPSDIAVTTDRATTERHAKLLRELVKQPDNKLCADCKKNGKYQC